MRFNSPLAALFIMGELHVLTPHNPAARGVSTQPQRPASFPAPSGLDSRRFSPSTSKSQQRGEPTEVPVEPVPRHQKVTSRLSSGFLLFPPFTSATCPVIGERTRPRPPRAAVDGDSAASCPGPVASPFPEVLVRAPARSRGRLCF